MLPFNLNDALRPIGSEDGPNVALDTRLDNRVLDLRVRLVLLPSYLILPTDLFLSHSPSPTRPSSRSSPVLETSSASTSTRKASSRFTLPSSRVPLRSPVLPFSVSPTSRVRILPYLLELFCMTTFLPSPLQILTLFSE
jgi:hypothetical protein